MNKEMYSNSYDFVYLLHFWFIIYYIYGSGFHYIYGGYYIYGWLLLHLWLVLPLFSNRPFYRYGGHIELIRFKEYYRMPRGHEHTSFVFSSAFKDIFSWIFLRIRL